MTGIGSRTHGLSSTHFSPSSLGVWFDAQIDSFLSFMTRVLCRASRGWLCPPDMTSVMYPEDAAAPELGASGLNSSGLNSSGLSGSGSRVSDGRRKGCCNEDVSGK